MFKVLRAVTFQIINALGWQATKCLFLKCQRLKERRGGRVLTKVLYGEVPPEGPTLTPPNPAMPTWPSKMNNPPAQNLPIFDLLFDYSLVGRDFAVGCGNPATRESEKVYVR